MYKTENDEKKMAAAEAHAEFEWWSLSIMKRPKHQMVLSHS